MSGRTMGDVATDFMEMAERAVARTERVEAERDRLAEALRSIDRLLVKEELSEGIEVTIPPDNHQLIGQIVLSYLASPKEAGDG